jgi:hypothetical protein
MCLRVGFRLLPVSNRLAVPIPLIVTRFKIVWPSPAESGLAVGNSRLIGKDHFRDPVHFAKTPRASLVNAYNSAQSAATKRPPECLMLFARSTFSVNRVSIDRNFCSLSAIFLSARMTVS